MGTALARFAMTETYEDVVKLIHHTVHYFIGRYGEQYGDYDELFAQANYEFMIAYRDWNGRSKFSTWCRRVILCGLLELTRNHIRRDRRRRITAIDMTDDTTADPVTSKFRVSELMDELSDDAKLVAKLVLEPSPSLARIMAEDGGSERQTRATIRQYLLGLGWVATRITESFDEISQALE